MMDRFRFEGTVFNTRENLLISWVTLLSTSPFMMFVSVAWQTTIWRSLWQAGALKKVCHELCCFLGRSLKQLVKHLVFWVVVTVCAGEWDITVLLSALSVTHLCFNDIIVYSSYPDFSGVTLLSLIKNLPLWLQVKTLSHSTALFCCQLCYAFASTSFQICSCVSPQL